MPRETGLSSEEMKGKMGPELSKEEEFQQRARKTVETEGFDEGYDALKRGIEYQSYYLKNFEKAMEEMRTPEDEAEVRRTFGLVLEKESLSVLHNNFKKDLEESVNRLKEFKSELD